MIDILYRKENLKVQKGEQSDRHTLQERELESAKRRAQPLPNLQNLSIQNPLLHKTCNISFLDISLGSFKNNPIFCNWAKFVAAASSFQLAQNLDLCQNESTCVTQPFWLLKSWLGECILAKQTMDNRKWKMENENLPLPKRKHICHATILATFSILHFWIWKY